MKYSCSALMDVPFPPTCCFFFSFSKLHFSAQQLSPFFVRNNLFTFILSPQPSAQAIIKPVVMNLNVVCLWSQLRNKYLSEISLTFSSTLWSLRRRKAQNYYQNSELNESSRGQERFQIISEWHSTILSHAYLCLGFVIPDCFTFKTLWIKRSQMHSALKYFYKLASACFWQVRSEKRCCITHADL